MSAPSPAVRRVPPGFMAEEPWWWLTGNQVVIDPVAGRVVLRAHRFRVFTAMADRPVTDLVAIRAVRRWTGGWGLEFILQDGETWCVRALHPIARELEAFALAEKARETAGLP